MTPMEFILCVLAVAAGSFVGVAYSCDWIARALNRRRDRANVRAAYALLKGQTR